MIDKLILGTANFGLEYGIANKRKLSREEVFKILELARSQGIWGIDTAKAYGDAEKIIGDFFALYGKIFKVISKLPQKEYLNMRAVEDEVYGSLKDMNISSIDFLLIHSFETYQLYGKTIIPVMQSLCKDKVIGCFGISVYHPEELEMITSEVEDPLAVEFPLNLFDQRFLKGEFLQRLKDKGGFLFARSVFLQGLFFLEDKVFAGAGDKVRTLREISEVYHIRPEWLALLFVITNSLVDKVVIGIDSMEQLMRNIQCLCDESICRYKGVEHLLSDLEVYDEDIILPYRWRG